MGEAFNILAPTKGRIDFLSVIGPMVLIADMHYISKAALLFSIYDFNSSGSVNRAEFFIGVRTLFKGLARFFKGMAPLSMAAFERIVCTEFDKIDQDCSELILFGEAITFVYENNAFRMMTWPFQVKESRIYEEPIFFCDHNFALAAATEKAKEQLQRKLKYKIRLTPDPADAYNMRRRPMGKKRIRPWKEPVG